MIIRVFFALAALMSATATPVLAEAPMVERAIINPTPPGAKVSAAYLKLHNPGTNTLSITRVSSPAITRVEIHRTEMNGDVASMRKQDGLEVGAGETVLFTHGGLHLMLMDLTAPMKPGDLIPIIFHTNEGEVLVDFRVNEDIELHDMGDSKTMEHGKMSHGDSEYIYSVYNYSVTDYVGLG